MLFVFALLSIEIIGAILVLMMAKKESTILEFLSLSFMIGSGFVVFELYILYLIGASFTLVNMMVPAVMLFVFAAIMTAVKGQRVAGVLPSFKIPEKFSLLEKLLISGICIQVIWTVFLTIPIPVNSHDAVASYALKAKMFYFSNGVPEGFFKWSENAVSHPDYPLFLPFIMTWIYEFTGFNDLIVKMIMPVFYCVFLVLVYSQLKNIFNRSYSILAVFILATIPQVADYATIIHADLILAAFVTGAFLFLLRYIRTGGISFIIYASFLLATSILVKNEAIVFAGAFFLVLLASFIRKRDSAVKISPGALLLSIVIVTTMIFPWIVIKFSGAAGNADINIGSLTFNRFLQNVKDLPVFLNLFQQEIFGPKKWNIFWIIVFAAAIWKRKYIWKAESFYIALFLIISFAGYFMAYMVTTGENLYFYVNTTISRFMIHFSGIALLFTAFLVYDEVKEIPAFSGNLKLKVKSKR